MEPEMYDVAGQVDLTSEDDSLPPPSGLTKSKLGDRINAAPPTAAAAAKEAETSKTVARAAQGRKNPAPASATTAARPGPATKKAKKAKPANQPRPNQGQKAKGQKAQKAYTLIWVCHWGKCGGPGAQNRPWRKKDLKIVGIYSTKAAAEQARREVMQNYDNAGHGDIVVGWKQDDEIDLIIRDAPLHM